MAIAQNSSDQKRMRKDKGIGKPSIGPGMNKLPTANSKPDDDRTEAYGNKESDKEEDAEIIDAAKKRFKAGMKAEDSNRSEGAEDLKFLNGDQWSAADASARAADGRPCITENRLPTFANQITNDQRQNRPQIVISPLGDKAAKKDAKYLRGMIRAIERDSSADVAYDTGFASAVHNGWGYWRILTEYEGDKSFNQVITIKSVPNPFNVILDPGRTPFELNASWGIISEMMQKEDFEREYPGAAMMPWGELSQGQSERDWITETEIRVAEYFWLDHEERELVMYDNGHEGWEDELDDDLKARIKSGKVEELARRTVQVKKLKWAKITSLEVLEQCDMDGQYIPIIECLGTVINLNGRTVKKGIIRDAKAPQLMSNYYATLEAENVALQPKAPWIMEEGQVEGHESKWQQANKKSYSYLLYKATDVNGAPAPPPQRQAFQGPPAAILAAKQGCTEALKAVTGIRFDATMSERMQDESGRAIRELNNNANLGAYHYIDNFGRALRNTGIVLIDLIPIVYDTKRVVAMLDESGAEDRIMIDPNMMQPHKEVHDESGDNPNGKTKLFNPKIGRYQVTCTIGPSYATKRTEATDSIMKFMQAVPAAAPMIMDLVAQNADWEGAEMIASRLAKAVPANLVTPDREDMSPQIQGLLEGMEKQLQDQAQQMELMQKELTDRQKDRDVALKGIDSSAEVKYAEMAKRFEAVLVQTAQKMEDTAAKKEMHIQGTIGRQLAELAKAVQQIGAQSASAAPAQTELSPTVLSPTVGLSAG